MDKVWYENPSKSEVIGPCGGDEQTEWPRRTDKCQTLKKITRHFVSPNYYIYTQLLMEHVMLLIVYFSVNSILHIQTFDCVCYMYTRFYYTTCNLYRHYNYLDIYIWHLTYHLSSTPTICFMFYTFVKKLVGISPWHYIYSRTTVICHCYMSLLYVIVISHCYISLLDVIVICHCYISLLYLIVISHCYSCQIQFPLCFALPFWPVWSSSYCCHHLFSYITW